MEVICAGSVGLLLRVDGTEHYAVTFGSQSDNRRFDGFVLRLLTWIWSARSKQDLNQVISCLWYGDDVFFL